MVLNQRPNVFTARFGESKRKAARSPLFEIARVLVRFDHVARAKPVSDISGNRSCMFLKPKYEKDPVRITNEPPQNNTYALEAN